HRPRRPHGPRASADALSTPVARLRGDAPRPGVAGPGRCVRCRAGGPTGSGPAPRRFPAAPADALSPVGAQDRLRAAAQPAPPALPPGPPLGGAGDSLAGTLVV